MPKPIMDMYRKFSSHELTPEEEKQWSAKENTWGVSSEISDATPATRGAKERALKSGDTNERDRDRLIFELDELERRERNDPEERRNYYAGKGDRR